MDQIRFGGCEMLDVISDTETAKEKNRPVEPSVAGNRIVVFRPLLSIPLPERLKTGVMAHLCSVIGEIDQVVRAHAGQDSVRAPARQRKECARYSVRRTARHPI